MGRGYLVGLALLGLLLGGCPVPDYGSYEDDDTGDDDTGDDDTGDDDTGDDDTGDDDTGDDDTGDDDTGDDDTGDDDTGDDDTTGGDQPPSTPVVEIQPQQPAPNEGLLCDIVTPSVDPEGAAVTYFYTWQVDANPTGFATEEIPPGIIAAGQDWTCTVVPYDGNLTGLAATDQVTVGGAPPGYYQVQDLSGGPSSTPCPDCDFAFDVTYTTTTLQGVCAQCLAFADGVEQLGYMGLYDIIALYIYYPPYAGWYLWYYTSTSGYHIEFYWNGSGYTQYGYWDVALPDMTGKAFNTE